MDLITLDFETYYDKEYSLSKLTTEEYVRDPRFEAIGIGVKVNNGPTEWASGTHTQLEKYFTEFDWSNAMVLAHNTLFDGAILSWRFGINPRVYTDTLCIARALHGVEVGGSLRALSERYCIGEKGLEVNDAIGKRRKDFTTAELDRYGDYCVNDVELTYKLFHIFLQKGFPKKELRLIDLTLRMFTDPVVDLDLPLLEEHLQRTRDSKDELLSRADVAKEDLMSNQKFAGLLEGLGVEPPLKISPATGKETFAFAKSDDGFTALAEHDNPKVQALVSARLGNKSTLEETRTQRFIDIAKRGKLPIPVRYYAAHTGRWGGDDKVNIQNLPSRGPNGKRLKYSIVAPDGHTMIDADSSQIEARVLAWLAGQDDLTEAFARGDDVYIAMASRIYNVPEDEITKEQRFVGKTTILGAGYGMGAVRFQDQLKAFDTSVSLDEARRIINIYREANWKISQFWRDAQRALQAMHNNENFALAPNVLQVDSANSGIKLPNQLLIRYDDLQAEPSERGVQFSYKTRRGRTKIYGGKVTENICQALARCIIGEQMLEVAKRYKVVLTVHDSIVCCVPEDEIDVATSYIETAMNRSPAWALGLPITCESGIGKSYGEAADNA